MRAFKQMTAATFNAYKKGNYQTALKLAKQANTFAKEQLGAEHPDTLSSINNLAFLYQSQGRYRKAEPLLQRALVGMENVLGKEHPRTLRCINNLASLYQSQGHYGEAESLYQRALAVSEKVLGKENPQTLTSLSNLAALYQSQGRYGEAEPLLQRVLAVREKVLGKEHPDTLTSANNLAGLYESQGRYGEAEPLYQRVLAISEKVLGKEHPNTLASINNLALLYQSQGRYEEAEPLLQRVLAVREKVLGNEHPDTLTSANNLAALYESQGRYGEAESLYQRVLAISEKVLGNEHPDTLTSANNLALLYQSQGRYEEAEPLLQRALAVREKVLGKEHPDTLASINNLALLYQSQGRYEEAEPLLQRALVLSEKVLGKQNPQTLTIIHNLAALYGFQGRYGEAEPLLQRVLAVREKALGKEHPDTLESINNFAFLYQSQGRYGEATPLYQRALSGKEKVLGKEHPNTLRTQLNYVVNLITLNKPEAALQQLQRLEPRLLELAALRLRNTRQESVRRRFLSDQSDFQDTVLTLAIKQNEPRFNALAGRVLLRWKRIQEDEERYLARLVRSRSASSQVKTLARKITRLRGELTALINQVDAPPNLQRTKLNQLEASEAKFAQLSREFKHYLEVRQANLADVSAGLSQDAVLVEFRFYHPFDFKTGKRESARFVAMLLDAGGKLTLQDVGAASEIAKRWRALRKSGSKQAAASLYQQLFGKIDRQLRSYKQVYIAPDHFLNLVAFARLVTADDRYWTERDQLIRQIASGRYLIKHYDKDLDKPRGMITIGGVQYDRFPPKGLNTVKASGQNNSTPVTSTDQLALADEKTATRTIRAELGGFALLNETGPEASEVAQLYWDYWGSKPEIWKNFNATEARLKTLEKPPSVLHFATHGFYLPKNETLVDRPMMLSGLALAGANRGLKGERGPDGEDGILYALEAQNLNLTGTKLVTLSACDTGIGTLDYSEGVYGLVRAFQIAGAKNVLMSLWRLNDHLAREFMKRFYSRWLNGSKPGDLAETLRETQLSFIHDDNPKLRDPAVWAPYVLVESR